MNTTGQARSGRFSVTTSKNGEVTVLHVTGDLDVLTAPTLGTRLDVALAGAPSVLIVDLSEVEFLSSAGISMLVETHRLTERAGMSLRVVAEGPATSRPLRMMSLDDLIDIYPTVDEAVRGRE